MDSKFFEIASYNLKLKVELFTIDYIEKKLGDFIDKNSIHYIVCRGLQKNGLFRFKNLYGCKWQRKIVNHFNVHQNSGNYPGQTAPA